MKEGWLGTESEHTFKRAFEALAGFEPLAWQCRLYGRLAGSDIPKTCAIPTGLGKTAVIHTWLIALANHPSAVPRRLIYIVNRRTVVDQATDVARGLRERLNVPADLPPQVRDVLRELRDALQRLAAYPSPDVVAISTLRGELADNEEWKKDPARPAIIIGTIDMIGSKLLFSGYGDRRYGRAHHAGLIGHDALIVHDEAHLTPAFGALLRAVEREQEKEESLRCIHVIELTATGRQRDKNSVTLEPTDEHGDSGPARILRQRLDAEKRLIFPASDGEGLEKGILKLTTAHASAPAKVLIYVTKPEDAKAIASALRNQHSERVELLTGTVRGYERDQLVKTRVFRELLDPDQPATETVYLVSTSAGEVGVDFDADHMICDLATLDSMIQRLGRVNRRGGRVARVDVVAGETTDAALIATRATLERVPTTGDGHFNASPRAVTDLLNELTEDEKRAAFAMQPPAIPATDILFDAWSLTSIVEKLPGRPEVAKFLHGITNDPPETYVAWRREVTLLSEGEAVRDSVVREWFRGCRLKSHELLRDRTDRVFQHLAKIRDRAPETTAVLLDERGNAKRITLEELPKKKDDAVPMLAYRIVVLPVEAGSLTETGMLDGAEKRVARDVAEEQRRTPEQLERSRARLHLRVVDREFWARSLDAAEDFSDAPIEPGRECNSPRNAAGQLARECRMKVSRFIPLREPPEGAEDEPGEYLVLLIERADLDADDPENAPQDEPPSIAHHTRDVVKRVARIADALQLEAPLKQALILAAELHDSGKGRDIWQRAIFNFPVKGEPLAKPGIDGMDGHRLAGYRHEFGSLLDASSAVQLQNVEEDVRELALHLIAAHHGHGRPHFEPESYNFEHHGAVENEAVARETMRRFGRLQLRYGRWQLAWLESLLRCADAAASAEPSPRTPPTP